MKFHTHPLYKRARLLLAALALPLASTALFGQVYGPLQNVRLEAHDQGAVFFWDFPEGYDPLNADPTIWTLYYKRDGGDPVPLVGAPIDAPLDPKTTYSYELYGTDSQGTIITQSATAEVTIPPAGSGITTSRVSLTIDGSEREFASQNATISGNGRFVAYASYDYEGFVNSGSVQILRHDRETGETIVVSKNADGDYADRNCDWPSISADGRFIVFASLAKNLSPEDADVRVDIYLYDAQTDTVSLVTDAPGVGSGNGQASQLNSAPGPAVSADGSTVAFIDTATNLHPEATEVRSRTYLYNTLTTQMALVPEPTYTPFNYLDLGPSGVSLSGDGSLVVFPIGYRHNKGFQENLQVIWQFDRDANEITPVTRRYGDGNPAAGLAGASTVSRDGRFIAFAWSNSNAANDRILDSQAEYALSIRYSHLHKAGFILDRQSDTLEVFTLTPYNTTTGNVRATTIISLSDDGRFVAFSDQNNASSPHVAYTPENHAGVFVRDRALGRTTLASRASNGDFTESVSGGIGTRPSISGDGSAVVYESKASNLVGGDTNNELDIFLTGLDLTPPDLSAPTWPGGSTIEATNTGATLVDLVWSAAEDIGGSIAGYRIFGDGELIANTGPNERTLQVPGLDPETTTTFKVEALDGAGNISSDGPAIEVTTKALSSGNASLSAPSLDGGKVQLAWDPAEETVLGYVIRRRSGGGDWVDLGEVGPGVTTFLDSGLPASATLSYRIFKKPLVGDPLPHSAAVEVTTRALSISSTGTALPLAADSREILTIGGAIGLSMIAESGRNASATINTLKWIDPLDPEQGTTSAATQVALIESGGSPGIYSASWILPEGTTTVTSVEGSLADGSGSEVTRAASGFPHSVEARFAISVDGNAEDYAEGLVFSLWSETLRAGCSRAIAGSTTIEKGGLPPGTDFRLRILQGNRIVKSLAQMALRSGLTTTIDQTLEPATPALFLLKDPDGEPRGDFLIGLYETDTDRFLGWGTVAGDGIVDAAPGVFFSPGSEVVYRLVKKPWDIAKGPFTATIPAFGQVGTLNLEWGPYFVRPGIIEGSIVDPDGEPVSATVSAFSGNEGVQEVTKATTVPDGSFSLDPVYATVNLTARGRLRDPTNGSYTTGVATGSYQIPNDGGTIDIGTLTLEPVLRLDINIRAIELLDPLGNIQSIVPGFDPLADLIELRVIRPGFLRSDARASGSDEGLRIEVEYPVGTDYLLLVDGGDLGYGITEITGMTSLGDAAADGTIRVDIESVQLEWTSTAFVTAAIHHADGTPLGPEESWTASTVRDTTVRKRQYGGSGPDLLLPTAIGPGVVRISLVDQPEQIIVTPLTTQTGENALGTLAFTLSGRFRSSESFSLSTGPRLLGPGMNIRAAVRLRNLLNTAVEGASVTLHLPPGILPVDNSILVGDNPVAGTFSDEQLTIALSRIEPGDTARVYAEFALTPEFDGDSVSLYATTTYTGPEGQVEEQVGSEPIEVIRAPVITGPELLRGTEVLLSGRSPVGMLQIFDEDELIGSRRVSSQGYWKQQVRLADRKAPYWHRLTATVTTRNGSVAVSEPFEILHHPGASGPTQIRFRQPPVLKEQNAVRLLQLFPDVVEWTSWEVGPKIPTFWRRILAGFPFEFELQFDNPESVADLEVTVAGPGGGTARATLGDDRTFRATIETDRNGWSAGPISIEYEDASVSFPKWGNELEIIEFTDPPEVDPGPSPTEATPADIDANNAYVQGGRIGAKHRDIDITVDYRVTPDVDLPDSDTATISYPGGSLSYPAITVPFRKASFDYSFTGNKFRFTTEIDVDFEQFLRRDSGEPTWGEDAGITVAEPTATSVVLNWPRALDDLWIQEYVLIIDGTERSRIPGGRTNYALEGLTAGTSYDIALRAIDGAGLTGPDLSLQLLFNGETTTVTPTPTIAAQQPQDDFELAIEEILRTSRPVAALGATGVRVAINFVGNGTSALDGLNLASDYLDAADQVNRWKDMIDAMDSCGVPPALKEKVNDNIDLAAAALGAATYYSTVSLAAGVTAAATGVALPVGAAIAVQGVLGGYVLGEIAENATANAESSFQEAMASNDDCEEPDDPRKPRRKRNRTSRTIADPVWKIDPSGFVYEVIEDNRLEGVTATLLHGESENGPWEVSAAEEFGEINPQITPVGGAYRWDVPAGWWQVMYQKEGYETTFSDVLPVPPPHFDVNIPLKSLAPPEVTAVTSLNNGAALRIEFVSYIRATMASPDTVRLRDSNGNLLAGQVFAPTASLVDNPHTESTSRDVSDEILFVPTTGLTIGSTYTVEIDGVIESYGEIPLGETASIEVTITDDRSGTWFGTFDPGGGIWTMNVGEDGNATLSGYDPDTDSVFEVEGTVDGEGNVIFDLGNIASGAQLTGTISDGAIAGTVSIVNYAVEGSRSLGEVAAVGATLTYHGAVVGSTGTTVTATIGPDGTVLTVIAGELATTATSGAIDNQGMFSGFLSDGSELELDLSDPGGGMTGVLALIDSGSWEILGALAGSPKARLVNVSGRAPVRSGNGNLIAGFVVRGSAENPMLVRAIGPGLENFGLQGVLQKPRIRLVDQSKPVDENLIAENANWLEAGNRNELRAVFAGLGAFFLDDARSDATVYVPVTPGSYTAVVEGVDGEAGITLVETYDADLGVFGTTSEGVANLSLRGDVGTGAAVMIAGFVIDGDAPRRVLLRGVGPALAGFGVQGTLTDPAITLYQGDMPVRDNQSWSDFLPNEGLAPVFQIVGAFALESGSKDAAIVLWLAPGRYTVHLESEDAVQGIGLIEIYDLP